MFPVSGKLPAVSTDGDSGNISGTSRENTPESVHQKFDVFQHKKNDSLVSAASSSNADKVAQQCPLYANHMERTKMAVQILRNAFFERIQTPCGNAL